MISGHGLVEKLRENDIAFSARTEVCCYLLDVWWSEASFSLLSAFMPRVSPKLGLDLISAALSQN